MLGINGFNTKKELKNAIGTIPDFIETSYCGTEYNGDGDYSIVAPTPYNRKWFAVVTVKNGLISKVT